MTDPTTAVLALFAKPNRTDRIAILNALAALYIQLATAEKVRAWGPAAAALAVPDSPPPRMSGPV